MDASIYSLKDKFQALVNIKWKKIWNFLAFLENLNFIFAILY